jgi:hypothetical protein
MQQRPSRQRLSSNADCAGSHPLVAGRNFTVAMPTFRYGSGLSESMLVFVDKVICLREFREI